MKKNKAPIFYKLIEHYRNAPISFHIPGHKMGKGFNPLGKEYYNEILKLDVTEISGMDDLHYANGIILEAQNRAARIFKAEKTFFLVNGSTAGNLAMILATCKPGDKIIVQSNVHKSVINGILLAKAIPIYIRPELIRQLGVPGALNENELINALNNNKNVKAVFITNPNYYGISVDLKMIVEIVHSFQIPLLVDEAHGAHYGLHPEFPKSAIETGADIAVQSTHKTLSAMTMGSMLHVKSKYIDIERLSFYLSIIQTSSPSYPIMASLDLTCEWIESTGVELWSPLIADITDFNKKATSLNNINVNHQLDKRYKKDPLRIIINSIEKSFSGVQIKKFLEDKRIYTELSDVYNTLAIASLGTNKKDLEILFNNLEELNEKLGSYENNRTNTIDYLRSIYNTSKNGHIVTSLEKILFSKTILVDIGDALGGISAEMITPYPPGIPLIQIGEKITEEYIIQILKIKNLGIKLHGLHGKRFDKLRIVKN